MKTILMVEDDTALQNLFREAIGENYKLVTVTNAREGIDQIKKLKPDLVLLDIMLPGGMNGFDVLENIKGDEQVRHIPVVVLTNLDSERKTAIKIGAVDYLVKANTSIAEVVAKVRRYLG